MGKEVEMALAQARVKGLFLVQMLEWELDVLLSR